MSLEPKCPLNRGRSALLPNNSLKRDRGPVAVLHKLKGVVWAARAEGCR
jgi:hypothetical protein